MSDNEKGFLQVNNQIVDYWMAHLTSAEFKTLLAIVRKTKGWNKPYDRISQSQIAELTGLTTRSVRTAISLLEDKKLIIVAGDDRKTRLFSVNYNTVNDVETDVTAIEKAIKDAEVISKDAEVISHKEEIISKDAEVGFLHNKHYTKDTNNINIKDTTASAKKEKPTKYKPVKPDEVSEQTWNDLLALRKAKKGVDSETAWKTINNALEKTQQVTGHSLEQIIIEWVTAEWKSFKFDWYMNRTKATNQLTVNNQGSNYGQQQPKQQSAAQKFDDMLDQQLAAAGQRNERTVN